VGLGEYAFPIYESTRILRGEYCKLTCNAATYSVTIPSCIAPGEYLLRIEQLGIHNPGSPPQFYISCAQIKVTGGGSKSLSPTTKIPGHVKSTDPGYTVSSPQVEITLQSRDTNALHTKNLLA
jgi:hypothetical protein